MAKLTFPGVAAVYSKGISEFRTKLTDIAEWARKSPQAIPAIAAQLAVLTAKLGVTLAPAGTPSQPTALSAVLNGTGAAVLLFAGGANTASFTYATSTDGVTYSAHVALAANRRVTGVAAGSTYFVVKGVNASGSSVASAASVPVTIT